MGTVKLHDSDPYHGSRFFNYLEKGFFEMYFSERKQVGLYEVYTQKTGILS